MNHILKKYKNAKHTRKNKCFVTILCILVIVFSMTLLACPEELALAKLIINSSDATQLGTEFRYDDISVQYGIGGTIDPITANFPTAGLVPDGVVFTVKEGTTRLPNGITLNTITGKITIASTAVAQASTAYTIIASAGSRYIPLETIVSIEITLASLGTAFRYDDSSVEHGVGGTITPTTTGFPTSGVSFTVKDGTSLLPNGITLNAITGEITITSTAAVQAQSTYRIIASSSGYASREAIVKILITPRVVAGDPTIAGKLCSEYDITTKSALQNLIAAIITQNGNQAKLTCINTSKVTDMSMLFESSAFNGDISNWDTSKVTNMNRMFSGASAFNGDISNWDTSRVTDTSSMFYGATAFNGDISNWDVSQVTNMSYMFWSARAFNRDISGWTVSNVTNMNTMFYGTTVFNQDISRWDVSKVTNMTTMFYYATAFTHNLEAWNVASSVSVISMFSRSGVSKLVLPTWCNGRDCR